MPRSTKYSKLTKNRNIEWTLATDVRKRTLRLVRFLGLNHLVISRIFFFRSKNAKTRAIARIWGFSHIWQKALRQTPAYIIEVISERFDHLPDFEKDKVLLHEITHIPRNFSGALMPHIRRGRRNFHDKVHELIIQYEKLNR